jgi:hypothetical protein
LKENQSASSGTDRPLATGSLGSSLHAPAFVPQSGKKPGVQESLRIFLKIRAMTYQASSVRTDETRAPDVRGGHPHYTKQLVIDARENVDGRDKPGHEAQATPFNYAASLKSPICASSARLKAGRAVQRST